MKKLWILVSILVVVAVAAWPFRDSIPYVKSLPFIASHEQATRVASSTDGKSADSQGSGGRDHAKGQGGGRRNGGPPAVSTIAVEEATLPMDVQATGWAVAADSTNIAPRQQGTVSSIAATSGQEVKAGDLIVKMDDRYASAAVAKDKANIAADQANLAQAEAAFDRVSGLAKQSVESQQMLEQSRATRDSAAAKIDADKATLQSDQATLQDTEIRAPYNGRLGIITISPGAYLSAGVTIVSITRYDPIFMQFRLPQRYLQQLHEGLKSGATVDIDPVATGGSPVVGKLALFDNAVDQASGTVLVKAEFKNDKGLVWPGQSANVTVHFQSDQKQIVIPTVALRAGANGSFVYTVDDNHKVHVTPVEVARSNGDMTAIASGLSVGQKIIVEGQSELTDGQTVVDTPKAAPDQMNKVAQNAPVTENAQ
ncbi:efflux RND transporter periplasmic adaptor subunit [Agrobacterium larrymoorei]|uniref:Multidrug efflux system membrane fusion protein n=1 Tax=Agrobacterium larrymoorei TaxID=160699 RepID=A0ABU0UIJ1_9HYPH|nr:efflux RND transporter periplasmic adaptor subunit [Agrobacterium larrymoorei]MDQ1184762.1 multidrug efflux system membrane fusion protein [Agrobacterium larrymoorei]